MLTRGTPLTRPSPACEIMGMRWQSPSGTALPGGTRARKTRRAGPGSSRSWKMGAIRHCATCSSRCRSTPIQRSVRGPMRSLGGGPRPGRRPKRRESDAGGHQTVGATRPPSSPEDCAARGYVDRGVTPRGLCPVQCPTVGLGASPRPEGGMSTTWRISGSPARGALAGSGASHPAHREGRTTSRSSISAAKNG